MIEEGGGDDGGLPLLIYIVIILGIIFVLVILGFGGYVIYGMMSSARSGKRMFENLEKERSEPLGMGEQGVGPEIPQEYLKHDSNIEEAKRDLW